MHARGRPPRSQAVRNRRLPAHLTACSPLQPLTGFNCVIIAAIGVVWDVSRASLARALPLHVHACRTLNPTGRCACALHTPTPTPVLCREGGGRESERVRERARSKERTRSRGMFGLAMRDVASPSGAADAAQAVPDLRAGLGANAAAAAGVQVKDEDDDDVVLMETGDGGPAVPPPVPPSHPPPSHAYSSDQLAQLAAVLAFLSSQVRLAPQARQLY